MFSYVAAFVILILLSIPLLALILVVLYVFLRLFSLGCFGLASCIEATIPEEQKRWAEEGPDEEEMRLIEQEINNGNLSLD